MEARGKAPHSFASTASLSFGMTVSRSKIIILVIIGPFLAFGIATMITGGGETAASAYYSPNAFVFAFGPLSLAYSLAARALYPVMSRRMNPLAAISIPDSSQQLQQSSPLLPTALVTGANTGIGYETAKAFVQHHNVNVILACRSREKALEAARRINYATNTANAAQAIVLDAPLDLLSPTSISEYIQELVRGSYKIDVLVNNAGRNTHPSSSDSSHDDDLRRNGLFQANFLGHYQLTAELLRNNLLHTDRPNGSPARIVNLSSIMHHFVGSDSSVNVNLPSAWKAVHVGPPASPDTTYAMSKLAMILFSLQLNQKYAQHGIHAIAVNPGAVNSDIWRSLPAWLSHLFRLFYLTPQQGAAVSVAAAIGVLPPLQNDNDKVLYLQPYPVPYDSDETENKSNMKKLMSLWKRAFVTLSEIMGPFAGARLAQPRLPLDDGGVVASEALWRTSQQVTAVEWPEYE